MNQKESIIRDINLLYFLLKEIKFSNKIPYITEASIPSIIIIVNLFKSLPNTFTCKYSPDSFPLLLTVL